MGLTKEPRRNRRTSSVTGLDRRGLLRSGAFGLAVSMAPPSLVRAVGAPRRHQPNILFILADDLGYADVGCYGRREYRTPAIDGLATHGVRLTQAYANSAVCSATRVALATGRYQYRLPIGLEEPLRERRIGLPPTTPTLASLLRPLGYESTLIGKWHMGNLPDFGPLKSGYDHFWGFRGGALDYFDHRGPPGTPDLWDDDRQITAPGYLTTLLGQRAESVIRKAADNDRPFYVSLHFNAPHWPWEGPEDAAESTRLRALRGPETMFDADGGSLARFGRMVTAMDSAIGGVLRVLDDLDLARDTIVVFTSDNGGERYSDTWPFTGKKSELLEGGLRVPAIVRWPGMVRPNAVSDQVAISMDWLPTLLAAAGGAIDPAFPPDGISILPWLRTERPTVSRTLFWRYHNMAQRACRSGDWKYLRILGNEFLFNLAEDPLERANLKARHPAEFARLATAFEDWDSTMLPIDPRSYTEGLTGSQLADHFGIDTAQTEVTR